MLEFKRLTLDDIPLVGEYFSRQTTRSCDNTVGGSVMWRDYFDAYYAIFDETFVMRVKYLRGETAFSIPVGKNICGAINAVVEWCGQNDLPPVFAMATAADRDMLCGMFDAEVIHERDWDDYLYIAEELATFTGRKFNGQRNHTNAFKRENPSWVYEAINPDNIGEVIDFYKSSPLIDAKDSPLFYAEQSIALETLENFALYPFVGGMVRTEVGGKIVAFAVGELVGDTLSVHIEKGDNSVRGAYQMIVTEFVRHAMRDTTVYVNREDDAGDEGLRRSKLSYHPCEILEKFTIKIK